MTSSSKHAGLSAFQQIDRIVSGQHAVSSDVVRFIQHLQAQQVPSKPLSLHVAQQLLKPPSKCIFLFTGFVVPGRFPQGENDGPLGALVLARALSRAGLTPTVWVDPQLRDTARWLAAELGTDPRIRTIDLDELAKVQHVPDVAIAIEKPGQNAQGIMHTFDGDAITGGSIAIDRFFLQWLDSETLTLGIGDRGNEIGFGDLRHAIEELLPSSAQCQCGCGGGVVSAASTNLVLPAAVSNWGAYGLAAAMAILTQDDALVLDPAEERRLLHVAAVRGCVDGIQRRGRFGVDGLSGETSISVVQALQQIALSAIARQE